MRFRHLLLTLVLVLASATGIVGQGTPLHAPLITVLDSNGDPVNGAKIYVYLAGTTTDATTYTTAALTVAHPQPVVADSAGRATVFLAPGVRYKIVAKTSADVTLWTVDGVATAEPQAGFLAYNAGGQSCPTSCTVTFGTEVYDDQADFASNTFTARYTGVYVLCATVKITDTSAAPNLSYLAIATSNRTYVVAEEVVAASAAVAWSGCVPADMDAGDTATVGLGIAGGVSVTGASGTLVTYFSGYRRP